jgi:tripeptide aminopeptidase
LSESIDVTEGWKGAQNSLLTILGPVGVQGVNDALLHKRPALGT